MMDNCSNSIEWSGRDVQAAGKGRNRHRGNGGIGLAMARGLATAGARIVIAARNERNRRPR